MTGDYVYWNDHEKNYTGQINRRTGGDVSVLLRQDRFMGIRIIHSKIICDYFEWNAVKMCLFL